MRQTRPFVPYAFLIALIFSVLPEFTQAKENSPRVNSVEKIESPPDGLPISQRAETPSPFYSKERTKKRNQTSRTLPQAKHFESNWHYDAALTYDGDKNLCENSKWNHSTKQTGKKPDAARPPPKLGGFVAPKTTPNRIYSDRELARRADSPRINNVPNPNHNFPESFNAEIFSGNKTIVSDSYHLYTKPGSLNGRAGVFEIGVRPSASGRTEVITHRFFNPNK